MSEECENTVFNRTITGWRAKAIAVTFLLGLVALGYGLGIQH